MIITDLWVEIVVDKSLIVIYETLKYKSYSYTVTAAAGHKFEITLLK